MNYLILLFGTEQQQGGLAKDWLKESGFSVTPVTEFKAFGVSGDVLGINGSGRLDSRTNGRRSGQGKFEDGEMTGFQKPERFEGLKLQEWSMYKKLLLQMFNRVSSIHTRKRGGKDASFDKTGRVIHLFSRLCLQMFTFGGGGSMAHIWKAAWCWRRLVSAVGHSTFLIPA